jgi:L,D-transpeptidase YbiS
MNTVVSNNQQRPSDRIPMQSTPHIRINLARQRLELRAGDEVLLSCAVSTARNGAGERNGSECTPRGVHVIDAKIGGDCAPDTVFVARVPTGERCTPALRAAHPGRDWIITRILWLRGTEPGRNCGGDVDTRARYIYLHGAPEGVPMGAPGSRGCVRMRNADIMTLFERVAVGTPVQIVES